MTLYHFPDVMKAGGRIRHVYPIHQKALLSLIEKIPATVMEIWVFGSVITLKCGQGSDLDVCLVGDLTPEDTKNLWVLEHIPLDLLTVTKEEFESSAQHKGSIYYQIKTSGLKVWERGYGIL